MPRSLDNVTEAPITVHVPDGTPSADEYQLVLSSNDTQGFAVWLDTQENEPVDLVDPGEAVPPTAGSPYDVFDLDPATVDWDDYPSAVYLEGLIDADEGSLTACLFDPFGAEAATDTVAFAAKPGVAKLILADIHGTKCKTERTKSENDPDPDRVRSFKSTLKAQKWGDHESISIPYDPSHRIALNASFNPRAERVGWDVVRADDDAAELQMQPFPPGLPTLSAVNDIPTARTLALDKVGSFSVRCYSDNNGNGAHDESESILYWNFVSVAARVVGNNIERIATLEHATDVVRKGKFYVNDKLREKQLVFDVHSGTFKWPVDATPPKSAIYLSAPVIVVGGGGDGRRGTEKCQVGWIQNLTARSAKGIYTNSHATTGYVMKNATDGARLLLYTNSLDDQPPIPANETVTTARPMVDGNRDDGHPYPDGMTRELNLVPASTFGTGRRVEFLDSPSMFLPLEHPKFANEYLVGLDRSLSFHAYLCVRGGTQSHTLQKPGGHTDPGANVFGLLAEQKWKLSLSYIVTANDDDFEGSQTSLAESKLEGDAVLHDLGTAMSGEVCPPFVIHRTGATDARQ